MQGPRIGGVPGDDTKADPQFHMYRNIHGHININIFRSYMFVICNKAHVCACPLTIFFFLKKNIFELGSPYIALACLELTEICLSLASQW